MTYGFIHKGNSQIDFYIRVENYPEIGYLGYSLKEALKKYRNKYNLKGKHITFLNV